MPEAYDDYLHRRRGPLACACAIEAKRAGMRPLVIDKGCLWRFAPSTGQYDVLHHAERIEVGDLPVTDRSREAHARRGASILSPRSGTLRNSNAARRNGRRDGTGHDGAFIVHTHDDPVRSTFHRNKLHHHRSSSTPTGPIRSIFPAKTTCRTSRTHFSDAHPYSKQSCVVIGGKV